MKDINELIGLIKGIDFDGVINDMEVFAIQEWLDKNRGLVLSETEEKLINLLEDVLEDGVIDDREKDLVFKMIDDFNKGFEDTDGKLNELNGILNGVICDNVINAEEVYRLKDWMDKYGYIIREDQASRILCVLIDRILEDNIVTEDEETQLLSVISNKVKKSQFEYKLDKLCQKIKDNKYIGIDLIDILDDEMAMNEIHKRAERQLINAIVSSSYRYIDKEIIIISLVLIAMLNYDGSYYDKVREVYKKAYEYYSCQKVESVIREILSFYRRTEDYLTRQRTINVVLEKSIVPMTFLPAYFDFIYDIYKLNFEYELPENLHEEFKFVFDGLRNSMQTDSDSLSINVTHKTYKLIVTTKKLINSREGLDELINLSIIVVKLIDKYFWDKEEIVSNPYIKAGYEGWKQSQEKSIRSERNRSRSEFRSRWEPKLVYKRNKVYLLLPTHRISAKYDYRDIRVEIINNNEILYSNNECYIKEIIGGYQLEQDKVEIKNPLGKLSYKVYVGDKVLYKSDDKLYRNYIIFKEDGNEIENNTDYEGLVFICYGNELQDADIIQEELNYKIASKNVGRGDSVYIEGEYFNFSAMEKPDIYGTYYEESFIRKVDTSSNIVIFENVNVLIFETSELSDKFEVIIDNHRHKLNDFEYKRNSKAGKFRYLLKLEIENSGIHKIEVKQIIGSKSKSLFDKTFAIDKSLRYECKEFSMGNYSVYVKSDLLNRDIDKVISSKNFDFNVLSFSYGNEEYSFVFPLELEFYRLDQREWRHLSEDIWIDEIMNDTKLYIYNSQYDGMLVYDDSGKVLSNHIEVKDYGEYKVIPIGFLRSYSNYKFISLIFTIDGKISKRLVCCNQDELDKEKTEIEFISDTNELKVTPYYKGKNRVYFEILNNSGEKVYKSELLESGNSEVVDYVSTFEEYNIRFYEKKKGALLGNKLVLASFNRIFVSKDDLTDRSFRIKYAYYDVYHKNSSYEEKSLELKNTYIHFDEQVDKDFFKASIYKMTGAGKFYLERINPVEVEICGKLTDKLMDVYITNEGDGLLLDEKQDSILNNIDYDNAPDIFLYSISLRMEED